MAGSGRRLSSRMVGGLSGIGRTSTDEVRESPGWIFGANWYCLLANASRRLSEARGFSIGKNLNQICCGGSGVRFNPGVEQKGERFWRDGQMFTYGPEVFLVKRWPLHRSLEKVKDLCPTRIIERRRQRPLDMPVGCPYQVSQKARHITNRHRIFETVVVDRNLLQLISILSRAPNCGFDYYFEREGILISTR